MAIFFYILIASLLGIAGHWITLWAQGRTQSTFKEYLILEKGRTMSSVFSVISSAFVIYSGVPDDIAGKSLLLVLGGAYTAAYTLDSKFNKDGTSAPVGAPASVEEVQPEVKEVATVKRKIKDDKSKKIDDLLGDDRSL